MNRSPRRTLTRKLGQVYSTAILSQPLHIEQLTPTMARPHRSTQSAPSVPLALLGDSLALSVGIVRPDHSVGSVIAHEITTETGQPVDLRVRARVGATAASLHRQVERAGDGTGGVALIVVGGNDVLAPCRLRSSASHLERAVRHLRSFGWSVVVATCPEVRRQPALRTWVRQLAAYRSRSLSRLQTRAALRAGAHTVGLFNSAAIRSADTGLTAEDGFHPSASAYRSHLERVVPEILEALRRSAGRAHRPGDIEIPVATAARVAAAIPGLQFAPSGPATPDTAIVHLAHRQISIGREQG